MYDVLLTEKATSKLKEAARWWAKNHSAEQAERWYEGFLKAVTSLRKNPQRCRVAPEDKFFPIEMRELHYGLGKRATHRAVFTIRTDRVVIYTIRHVAQAEISPDDF